MWLNLRQEGRYWDAAGLGGGQTLEFSAEAGKHGNNGLAGVFNVEPRLLKVYFLQLEPPELRRLELVFRL